MMQRTLNQNVWWNAGSTTKFSAVPASFPDPVVVTRDHTELIRARIEVCIESLPARSNILPLLILPFKLIAKTNSFGDSETCRRVGYLQISSSGRQLQKCGGVVFPAVSNDRFEQYGRWHCVPYNALGINPSQPLCCGKPYASVRCLHGRR